MGKKIEHHADHQELLDSAWSQSSDHVLVKGLNQGQKIEDLLSKLPGYQEAFSKVPLLDRPGCVFKCSDGRVTSGGHPAIALAGEGVLTVGADSVTLEQALKGKNVLILSHEECGASKMAHPGPDSDIYGHNKAKCLSADTDCGHKEVSSHEFRSPVHDERFLVVDGTLRFDCTNWSELPPQFLSSAPGLGLSDKYIETETKALAGIALDHGFGDRFDAANPFRVIVSAENQEQLAHLLTVTKSAVDEFGDRVTVDGFVAPDKN